MDRHRDANPHPDLELNLDPTPSLTHVAKSAKKNSDFFAELKPPQIHPFFIKKILAFKCFNSKEEGFIKGGGSYI